ncbi:phage protein Gp36 family protein [Ignavibacterium sp.]|uniref:phage protein Gp36 family protein n=1 Tax=Ignavibacterium sp. TaxID=2651167 RepID=UPI00307EF411
MAYLDLAKIEKYISRNELVKLTDDENTGAVNEDKLSLAINIAIDEVFGYLRDKYDLTQVPDPLPPELEKIAAEITIYHLYKRRFRLEMPESITEIFKLNIAKLEKIAEELLNIGIPLKTTTGFIKINKSDADRIFNNDLLDKL